MFIPFLGTVTFIELLFSPSYPWPPLLKTHMIHLWMKHQELCQLTCLKHQELCERTCLCLFMQHFIFLKQAPVLFKGIGHSLNPGNSLVSWSPFHQSLYTVNFQHVILCKKHFNWWQAFCTNFFLCSPSNFQVLKALSASSSSYSTNPNSKLSSPPSLSGTAISLVSVVQVHCYFFLFLCITRWSIGLSLW